MNNYARDWQPQTSDPGIYAAKFRDGYWTNPRLEKIQDIGQTENATTQTGKRADLTPLRPISKTGKSGMVTKRKNIMMTMMNTTMKENMIPDNRSRSTHCV